jgi:hypothetical protein
MSLHIEKKKKLIEAEDTEIMWNLPRRLTITTAILH